MQIGKLGREFAPNPDIGDDERDRVLASAALGPDCRSAVAGERRSPTLRTSQMTITSTTRSAASAAKGP